MVHITEASRTSDKKITQNRFALRRRSSFPIGSSRSQHAPRAVGEPSGGHGAKARLATRGVVREKGGGAVEPLRAGLGVERGWEVS